MRLSEFILTETEQILVEFEAFARTIASGDSMDIAALRDHAKAMLMYIANDIETPQNSAESTDKSRGLSDAPFSADLLGTAAQAHGSGRAESGFSVGEMVSEYRAMRASVIRLWTEHEGALDKNDVADLMRFNESIDQALAESMVRFTGSIERTRETFLAMLGHDLRSPLGAIITSAQFLQEVGELNPKAAMLVSRIVSSGVRMNHMVDDLLDFTRSQLGSAIPIVRKRVDLNAVITDAVDEVLASRPDTSVNVELTGDLTGDFDAGRVSQVLSNLLTNARTHGASGTPITVAASGTGSEIVISVHNNGPPIPRAHFDHIFDPLSTFESLSRDAGHLGLGLYIAKRIVVGHGGRIVVASSKAEGTTFTVYLPRTEPSAQPGPREMMLRN